MGKKFMQFMVLILIILLTGCNIINYSIEEDYNFDDYFKNGKYDYVEGTKIISGQNKNRYEFIRRSSSDEDMINEILAYFNSFKYTKRNTKLQNTEISYEFKFKNTANYSEIEIHIKGNRAVDILLKEKAIGKKNIILFLNINDNEIDMNYINQLHESLDIQI